MTINKKICPPGLKNNPNRPLQSVSYITIHNTGNYLVGATSRNHADYQYNGSGSAQASWHYTVDREEIWQSFEDTQECWHAGDGSNGPGNYTSIGIEICVNDRSGFKKACENAAWLTAELLCKHKLDISRVVQHNKWSAKNCPTELRSGEWGVTWNDFISLIKKYADKSQNESPIISQPTVTAYQMKKWAEGKKAAEFFIDLAEAFYRLSISAGVNPAVAYCQSAKETKYGLFGGVLDESFRNPCGMKTREGGSDSDPAAHQKFSCWEDGILAQIDHLALYAGADGYPKANTPDPRHFSFIVGKAPTVEKLSGNWAPSPEYGTDILRMMNEVAAVNPDNPDKSEEEPKTETIRICVDTSAENIDGHWIIKRQDGSLIKVRDFLTENGCKDIKWDESSRTITAGR